MDLEWAARVDSPVGNYSPKQENTPPEIRARGENALWTMAADMWQFGQLLLFWSRCNGSFVDDAGLELCANLTAESPDERLSATFAL
jgi:hypothetical protein